MLWIWGCEIESMTGCDGQDESYFKLTTNATDITHIGEKGAGSWPSFFDRAQTIS